MESQQIPLLPPVPPTQAAAALPPAPAPAPAPPAQAPAQAFSGTTSLSLQLPPPNLSQRSVVMSGKEKKSKTRPSPYYQQKQSLEEIAERERLKKKLLDLRLPDEFIKKTIEGMSVLRMKNLFK